MHKLLWQSFKVIYLDANTTTRGASKVSSDYKFTITVTPQLTKL